ncbi:MAG: ABC transporter ATP-binding protein [Lachnospiraceae bacterium]|nr:ABC transporter ATP-binding protein [Lachnospiraceae bacterium]
MSEIVLDIQNVSKVYKLYQKPSDRFKEAFNIKKKLYYKEFYALRNINFSIGKGETVGIVGRNGSGKSTLLKIITGVLNPTEGNVVTKGNISALLELGAGFNMDYTGIENIYLNGTIMGIPRKEMDKKIDSIISFADIGEHIKQPVKTYSSGMFVRLAFAVAINVDPEVLIVDEALAVGDTRFQVKCMEKFVEFMEAGKTVLFVSHDVNSVKRFCKRAIWLNEGSLVMDGDVDEVTDKYSDFLKSELSYNDFMQNGIPIQIEKKEVVDEAILAGVDIAEIIEAKIYNQYGNAVDEINHGENIFVKVTYVVNDTNIEKPVLGVALHTIDNEYICGLNTLLDNVEISWHRGLNECTLEYKKFNLTGGNYLMDVALFDKTATVQFDYKARYRSFFVNMDYIAEGKVVLNHEWH